MRGEIERIVADADASFDAEALWPAEEWDSWQTPTPLKALYVGGAGVVWALGALRAPRSCREQARPRRRRRATSSTPGGPSRTTCGASSSPPPPAPHCSRARRAFSPSPGSFLLTTRLRTRSSSASRRTPRTRPTRSCGARRERCSLPTPCTSGQATRAGWRPGKRAPTSSCGDARTTASGRPTSTAASGVASGLLTAWSATCSRCAGGCRGAEGAAGTGVGGHTGCQGRCRGRTRQLGQSRGGG